MSEFASVLDRVEAENNKLRADVERLKAENNHLQEQIKLMTLIVELEFAKRRRAEAK